MLRCSPSAHHLDQHPATDRRNKETHSFFLEPPPETVVQQVKLFKGVDSELPELERQINRWIRKSGARVLSINGNLAPAPAAGSGPMNSFAAGDVLIIVHVEIDTPQG
ncbi:hypothetical protein RBSWK_04127 [Rhodopirellula baltica SWK14]|uniref:Uncharacterized protein n=1 Tax=Rhodopirellula baltica SWK14 TaxID=993516 RepID=L7CEF8_RHOBT|nr:hypothetical protein RBSWK_04127 [Rhodopirellula baltica SWK14]